MINAAVTIVTVTNYCRSQDSPSGVVNKYHTTLPGLVRYKAISKLSDTNDAVQDFLTKVSEDQSLKLMF
jgi:hypothetical protein